MGQHVEFGSFGVDSWIYSYRRADQGFHWHVAGWRSFGERPTIDLCAAFQRDPTRGVILEPKSSLEKWSHYRVHGDARQVKIAVLVDIVEPIYIKDSAPNLVHNGVLRIHAIPSVVRLQPLDQCPFGLPQIPDLVPVGRRDCHP